MLLGITSESPPRAPLPEVRVPLQPPPPLAGPTPQSPPTAAAARVGGGGGAVAGESPPLAGAAATAGVWPGESASWEQSSGEILTVTRAGDSADPNQALKSLVRNRSLPATGSNEMLPQPSHAHKSSGEVKRPSRQYPWIRRLLPGAKAVGSNRTWRKALLF